MKDLRIMLRDKTSVGNRIDSLQFAGIGDDDDTKLLRLAIKKELANLDSATLKELRDRVYIAIDAVFPKKFKITRELVKQWNIKPILQAIAGVKKK